MVPYLTDYGLVNTQASRLLRKTALKFLLEAGALDPKRIDSKIALKVRSYRLAKVEKILKSNIMILQQGKYD